MNMLNENAKSNIISGFQKCGIHPINVDELLSRISTHDNSGTSTSMTSTTVSAVQASFIESLQLKKNEFLKGAKTNIKRRKLALFPGKSIGPEAINIASESRSKSVPNPGRKREKKQLKRKKTRNNEDEISTSSSSSDSEEIALDDSSDDLCEEELDKYRMEKRLNETSDVNTGILQLSSGEDFLDLKDVVRESGQYVLFLYEGEIFPGQIKRCDAEGAFIASMQRSCKSWKRPTHPDEHYYPWEDVLGAIQQPKPILKRGFYDIPELHKLWIK